MGVQMSKSIFIRVTGEGEKFLNEMNKRGLGDRDVIAKALGLFKLAAETERIAVVSEAGSVEYYFTVPKQPSPERTQPPMAGAADQNTRGEANAGPPAH